MQKNNYFRIFFKCCHRIDKNNKGYMFDGVYIENISAYLWERLHKWSVKRDKDIRHQIISVLADIKRRQSKNWEVFMKQPVQKQHDFKSNYRLTLSEIEPHQPYIKWQINDITVYETYIKLS